MHERMVGPRQDPRHAQPLGRRQNPAPRRFGDRVAFVQDTVHGRLRHARQGSDLGKPRPALAPPGRGPAESVFRSSAQDPALPIIVKSLAAAVRRSCYCLAYRTGGTTMRIALDPFMHRHLSLEELPRKVRELGYDWIELSPRGDFLEWFKAPRVFPEPDQGLQAGAEGQRREDRLAVADVPLGLERRGRAPGGRAPLEARHRDRGRAGSGHDELRVRARPAPGQGQLLLLPHRLDDRGLRGCLVALDGGAGADLRARGDQPAHRAAPRGLVRDYPAGGRHHPHGQLEA